MQVTFTCTPRPNIIIDPPPPEVPIVNGCELKRSPSGVFSLVVIGRIFRGSDSNSAWHVAKENPV